MLEIQLSGLFSGGKHQRGGGGARGEGHVVEVVLGGRSTLYHVYKRPYVDHFLKKVRFRTSLQDSRHHNLILCLLFRYPPGIRSSFSPPRCKSTPIQSLIGWTVAEATLRKSFIAK